MLFPYCPNRKAEMNQTMVTLPADQKDNTIETKSQLTEGKKSLITSELDRTSRK